MERRGQSRGKPEPAPPSARPGSTESEFGIPIPGRILPPEQWAKTALKKLPEGLWNWDELFGRSAPIVIDLGCGNGRSVLESALRRPELNHLGVDILPVVIRYATRRGNQRGLQHVRFAVIGGRELLERHVPPRSVAEIHCYHPQPYYTPQEVPKRLITPPFLSVVHRSLVPGGKLILQTDHPAYWRYIQSVVPSFFEWEEFPAGWPESPQGRTRREIIARRKGLPIFRGVGTALALDEDEVRRRTEPLPFPMFVADRSLQSLDRLEQEGHSSAPRRRTPPKKKRPRRLH
jgi:tRNA (guanine-N7-)-methyltransferase